MPSTTKLFLGVRGTRQGAASPGRPRQKALSRPLVHPSTRHLRDLGLLGLNLALLCLIKRVEAGHWVRGWGHMVEQVTMRLWGLPACPAAAQQQICPGISPSVPAHCGDCSGLFGSGKLREHLMHRGERQSLQE